MGYTYAICNGNVSECCQTELSSTDLLHVEKVNSDM